MSIEILYQRARETRDELRTMAEIVLLGENQLQDEIAAVTKQWRERNAELLAAYEAMNIAYVEADTALREAAIDDYRQNGGKQIIPGVSVRINTKLEYDGAVALDFAKTHGICLQLDKKEFEKVAPTIAPTLVTPVESISAVISFKD